jgi:hypothetical protein
MISKYNQYLKRNNLTKKTFIFTMSIGNFAMLFLDQLFDVGINVGSRYAQSILEMSVRNLSSCLGLHVLHSEELLTKVCASYGILCKVSNAQRSF